MENRGCLCWCDRIGRVWLSDLKQRYSKWHTWVWEMYGYNAHDNFNKIATAFEEINEILKSRGEIEISVTKKSDQTSSDISKVGK